MMANPPTGGGWGDLLGTQLLYLLLLIPAAIWWLCLPKDKKKKIGKTDSYTDRFKNGRPPNW